MEQESIGYTDKVNPDYVREPAIAKNEERVLGLMLLFPEHRAKVFREGLLTEDDFFTALNKKIFKFLKTAYEKQDDRLVSMSEEFTPEEMGRISKMKIQRMELSSNGEEVLLECIANLKSSVADKHCSANPLDRLNDLIKRKRETDDN